VGVDGGVNRLKPRGVRNHPVELGAPLFADVFTRNDHRPAFVRSGSREPATVPGENTDLLQRGPRGATLADQGDRRRGHTSIRERRALECVRGVVSSAASACSILLARASKAIGPHSREGTRLRVSPVGLAGSVDRLLSTSNAGVSVGRLLRTVA